MAISNPFKHSLIILSLLFLSVLSIYILKIPTSANALSDSPVQHKEDQSNDNTLNQQPNQEISSKVLVYYFYTTHRCYSCRMIEQYTKGAVDKFFKEELKSGLLEFKPLNLDEKGNKHFVKDYQLYTKSVIVSLLRDGKEVSYKNLERVWQYLKDEKKFFNYIKEETEKVLKEAK